MLENVHGSQLQHHVFAPLAILGTDYGLSHELGHLLGLDHVGTLTSCDPKHLMCPGVCQQTGEIREGMCDIAATAAANRQKIFWE